MSLFDKLPDLIRQLTGATQTVEAATQSLQENMRALREQLAAKHRELDAATGAPVPRAELVERFRALVDERATRFGRVAPAGHVWSSAATVFRPLADWRAPSGHVAIHDVAELFDVLCFVAGDAMKAGAPRLLTLEGWSDGLPSSERPEAIARLEGELAALEAAEEEAIDKAVAVGLVIAHRPEVAERRRQEAAGHERQERWTAAQREREALLDQRPAAQRGVVGRSEYVDTGRLPS
jgi:hypothetical protein